MGERKGEIEKERHSNKLTIMYTERERDRLNVRAQVGWL